MDIKLIDVKIHDQIFLLYLIKTFNIVVPELMSETLYNQLEEYAKVLLGSCQLKPSDFDKALKNLLIDVKLLVNYTHDLFVTHYLKYTKKIEKKLAPGMLKLIETGNYWISKQSFKDKEDKNDFLKAINIDQKETFLSLVRENVENLKLNLNEDFPYPESFFAYRISNVKLDPNHISLLANKILKDQVTFYSHITIAKILFIDESKRRNQFPNPLIRSKQTEDRLTEIKNTFDQNFKELYRKYLKDHPDSGVHDTGVDFCYESHTAARRSPFITRSTLYLENKSLLKLSKKLSVKANHSLIKPLKIFSKKLEQSYTVVNSTNSFTSFDRIDKTFSDLSYCQWLESKLIKDGGCSREDLIDNSLRDKVHRFFYCATHLKEIELPKSFLDTSSNFHK